MDDIAPNGFPRGWWGSKRPNQTGRPRKRQKPTKVYRLTEDWGELAKRGMQASECIDDRLAEALYAVIAGRADDVAVWLREQRRKERRGRTAL